MRRQQQPRGAPRFVAAGDDDGLLLKSQSDGASGGGGGDSGTWTFDIDNNTGSANTIEM